MTLLRIVGAALLATGLVLAGAPSLVSDVGPAADTFAAVERRIPWGGLAGVGMLLLARTQLRPWAVTIVSAILWVTTGLLGARLLGLALDGSHPRQWMWVAVELAVALGAAGYLRYHGRAHAVTR